MAAFASEAFATLKAALPFDSGSIITSFLDRPSFTDAHFHGLEDPRAVMASWRRVSHLDVLSPRVMGRPFEVHRLDVDAPEVSGPSYAPLREHLVRFSLWRTLCVAMPIVEERCATILLITRHSPDAHFTDAEARELEALAPHVAEAAAVCRVLALANHPEVGVHDLPVAVVDAGGRLVQTTIAFRRALFGAKSPKEPHLAPNVLSALRAGTPWMLPDGQRCLEAWLDRDGGMLVRVSNRGRLATLSARELDIARRYANGSSYTVIAGELGISPATVRNHIRHVYEKLDVRHRVALIEALGD